MLAQSWNCEWEKITDTSRFIAVKKAEVSNVDYSSIANGSNVRGVGTFVRYQLEFRQPFPI